MCGIVAGIAQRNVVPILIAGLKKLEYRGYDSAGMTIIDANELNRCRAKGKVAELAALIKQQHLHGCLGIAHTRWATHGKPTTNNAHPHISSDEISVVHNGIIENYSSLKTELIQQGYKFSSDTDTEVIAHLIHAYLQTKTLLIAIEKTLQRLEGSYALAIMHKDAPDTLIACRKDSPLVIGIGIEEYFVASDVAALLPVTQNFMFLEDGDIALIQLNKLQIYNCGSLVRRETQISQLTLEATHKAGYRHYMLKEIYQQPQVIQATLADHFKQHKLQSQVFGSQANQIFQQINSVHIIACGTSYHAGLIARYWFEKLAKIPCNIDVASEFRYRSPVIHPDTLIVTLSQSGETADTLAALQEAKKLGAKHSLAICNVAESSLVRASELVFLTQAGVEIGVASTKAFTTQLVALLMLVVAIGKHFKLSPELETHIAQALATLPEKITQVLALDNQIQDLAEQFNHKQHALFLGRGTQYPVAMEGALKLKEISYIHAEAYPAGELKHGPLALIDADMPVITVAPNNNLLKKLQSNMQEVSARGGQLIVFMDESLINAANDDTQIYPMPTLANEIAPIVYTIPLQLLAYHVAVLKGTDVDQPRNLAKSVTVE